MTEDDHNYFQAYEYTMKIPPDTRSRRLKIWHKLTFHNLRDLISYKMETRRYDRS